MLCLRAGSAVALACADCKVKDKSMFLELYSKSHELICRPKPTGCNNLLRFVFSCSGLAVLCNPLNSAHKLCLKL